MRCIANNKSSSYFEQTGQFLSGSHESSGLRGYSAKYATMLSYEQVESLLEERCGCQILSDQRIHGIVGEEAAKIAQGQKEQIAQWSEVAMPALKPGSEIDLYDADAKEILLMEDGISVAKQKAKRDKQSKGVALVAISPNSPLGLLYEELGYTDLNDDFEEMKIRAQNQHFDFPYLYDGDTETASLKYGPVATPHAFVFDAARKLCYVGRLDAVEKPGSANAEDLRVALDAVLAGAAVATPTTKTFGCSTKWGWKLGSKEKANEEWSTKPVALSKMSTKAVLQLLKNEGSEKLRLINIWATWCGPCILEYPDFIALQRMYGARDFEFVSLSADKPQQHEKVLKFLQEKHSAVSNYLFSEDDKYALIEAVDKNWNGALPYTVLVEPGGKIVWQHQGEVDFYALKRAIVEHPMMGRYF